MKINNTDDDSLERHNSCVSTSVDYPKLRVLATFLPEKQFILLENIHVKHVPQQNLKNKLFIAVIDGGGNERANPKINRL